MNFNRNFIAKNKKVALYCDDNENNNKAWPNGVEVGEKFFHHLSIINFILFVELLAQRLLRTFSLRSDFDESLFYAGNVENK